MLLTDAGNAMYFVKRSPNFMGIKCARYVHIVYRWRLLSWHVDLGLLLIKYIAFPATAKSILIRIIDFNHSFNYNTNYSNLSYFLIKFVLSMMFV